MPGGFLYVGSRFWGANTHWSSLFGAVCTDVSADCIKPDTGAREVLVFK